MYTFRSARRSDESGVVSGSAEASTWTDVFHVLIHLRSWEHFLSNLEEDQPF